MSGFSYRVSLVELQADKFVEDVKTACRTALIKAARSFLLAAIPNIPVFTGFARGAFGNLEDIAGRVQGGKIAGKLGGYVKAQNYAKRTYYYKPNKGERVVRNTITGRQFATPAADIFSQGRAKIAEGQSAIFFRFTVDISYVNYLDKNKWGAFKAGESAFSITLKAELPKLLPQIGKYLIKKDIK